MKKILVGLDASPRSDEVLDAAVELAGKTGAKLILLRVVTVPLDVPLLAWSVAPADLGGLLEREARKEIELVGQRLPPGLLDHTRVRLGTPWQSVCEMARDEDVDLIVVGSHGYSGVDRLIGTCAPASACWTSRRARRRRGAASCRRPCAGGPAARRRW
jgi:nucleotide-binding universal stress UspA family protein